MCNLHKYKHRFHDNNYIKMFIIATVIYSYFVCEMKLAQNTKLKITISQTYSTLSAGREGLSFFFYSEELK